MMSGSCQVSTVMREMAEQTRAEPSRKPELETNRKIYKGQIQFFSYIDLKTVE